MFVVSICVTIIKTIFSIFFFYTMRVNIFAAICGNYRQNNQQGFPFELYIPYQGNDKSHNLPFTGKKGTKLPTIRRRRQIKRRNFSRRCMKFLFKKKKTNKKCVAINEHIAYYCLLATLSIFHLILPKPNQLFICLR